MLRSPIRILAVLSLLVLAPPTLAAQYMDPGSGSVWIQLLIGGLAGLAAVFKFYWSRIRAGFRVGHRTDRHGA